MLGASLSAHAFSKYVPPPTYELKVIFSRPGSNGLVRVAGIKPVEKELDDKNASCSSNGEIALPTDKLDAFVYGHQPDNSSKVYITL